MGILIAVGICVAWRIVCDFIVNLMRYFEVDEMTEASIIYLLSFLAFLLTALYFTR